MGLERLDVVEVEPVVESAAQQVERLCEHAVVGHAVGEWRVDGLDVEESRRLSSLRDTLLPRLMSGELKINDISV